MAKKSRTKARDAAPLAEGEVGPRQPCPCGSGKRYKACHGAPGGGDVFVARPFEGLPGECDIVALRELVPAATAPLTIKGHEDRVVQVCTMLPGASPAMSRESGQVWIGLQVQHSFGDPSRDLAAVLEAALAAEEPGVIGLTTPPGPGPRLQDLVADETLEVTVHEGYDFWLADVEEREELADAMAQANEGASPTTRLTSVEAAYWTDMGTKEFLRWVMPEPEDALLDALSRLHASGRDAIVPEARLIGMFRAHGLLAPVWELPLGTGAAVLEEPAAEFKKTLDAAMADDTPLTSEERSTRSGLANRQVTIR
ncbi:DUF5926 family protein [Nocardioides rubriscoriae]|uniref:DUF5926 family protein n=1 Tax=Nocardioides rubriscoriae TaxID=642762 RepID=UPI0011E02500|nr:DUF5926 family protein [Nocardioides rubriscoriae]